MRNNQRVISRIDEALAGRSSADIILLDGDILTIPPRPNSVQVSGNVNLQGLIKYEEGRKVRYYLEQAGDILEDTDQILLTQATGATQRLKTRLFFFRQNPVVDDGAIILVTSKEDIRPEDRTDTRQIISESLAMVTSVLTVLLLTQGLK
ncbi:MAG: capsule biosynthesis GfcC family protein [Candidatus Marinimicrobia bacterium]|nr:capsule biosynthesis GfcC family protein [Candidatus Neomarinimicrobiota bacterium]